MKLTSGLTYRARMKKSTMTSATRPTRSQWMRERRRVLLRGAIRYARELTHHRFNAGAVLPAGASESRDALVSRLLPQLLLDAQELVVLRDAIRAGRRAGLDLPNAGRHGEVRDRGVLGLTGAMRHDGRVAGLPRDADRLERLRERPDLVHLDQDRVGDAALDPAPQ